MKCQVCHSENNPLVQHKVYKCSDCGHTFINYTEDGVKYHKTLYRKPNQEGNRGDNEVKDGKFTDEFHKRREGICKNRMLAIKDLIPEATTALDIGAGGGTFLKMLEKEVDVVEATEVSDLCAENLNEYGFKIYHGAFTLMDINSTYDLVTCWHVLEHVEDLQMYVKKVKQVVGKYLVIEIPVNRRLRNPDTEFDGHFHYFSEKSLKKLFENDFNFLYLGKGIQNPAILCIMQRK